MNKDDWKREERLKIDVVEVWNEVQRHIEDERKDSFINKNSRWKTIRIFVSSTFKDFHTERDVLVKEVFPELREWCQKRDLNLVECDLRWGVPEETPYCVTLQICLDEIRRCEQENKWPFFVNMISKRIGWIPLRDELPAELISDFNLVIGLSVTEMEIVEAAYRQINPNSLFMWRDEGFLKKITDEKVKQEFLDELNPLADRKMSILKQQIRKKYPEEQVCTYTCDYVPGKTLPHCGRTKLILSPIFKEKVIEFFKERINKSYVVGNDKDNVKENLFDVECNQHDAFMQQRAGMVVGRSDEIEKVKDYINGNSDEPLMLLGESGCGKSTVMAKVVYDILKDWEAGDRANRLTYFHFVGAVPKSTSLLGALRRFLHAMKQMSMPSKPKDVFEKVRSLLLESHSGEPTKFVIFIDALDQLDKDDLNSRNVIFSWLPKKLPPNVKCIFSMIPDSIPSKILKEHSYTEEVIKNLENLKDKNGIISKYLINFRKKLDLEQTLLFLNHSASGNPLWLITACEELRYFGEFKNLTEYIKDLPSTLEGLLYFVLERICRDMEDKDHVMATLCLMECSENGLLEVELLEMLAMLDTKTNYGECRDTADFCMRPRLISWKWGSIYRHLKTFIRPYGDSGEGRLNYYHKSMSNVVREKFLPMEYKKNETWELKCHKIMAIYFETTPNINRKIEEYPYHVIKSDDDGEVKKRLKKFLIDWEVVDILYDSEWSVKLLEFWRIVDGRYESLKIEYLASIDKFKKIEKLSKDDLVDRMETVARIFSQAGLEKEAMELGVDCLDILNSLESDSCSAELIERRNKANMYIHGFLAHHEVVVNRNYKRAIELHDKAIELNEKLSNQHDYFVKRYKALQYNKKAFCIAEYTDRIISPFKREMKKRLREEGNNLCWKAIKTYNEINDCHHELEVMLTKATLCKNSEEVHEIYKELMVNCKAHYGIEHELMIRCLHNDGTEYQWQRKHDLAYNRYKGAYLLSKHLFGPGHRSTENYLSKLKVSAYVKIAKKRNEIVEELTFDPDTLLSLDVPGSG